MLREYLRRIALWRVGEMVAIYFIVCKINKFLFMCIFFFRAQAVLSIQLLPLLNN